MSTGYTAVMKLAQDKPEWIRVVLACYETAKESDEFAGTWAVRRLGDWNPSLRPLSLRGILVKTDTSRGGKRAYYRMPERDGVEKALSELSVLEQ